MVAKQLKPGILPQVQDKLSDRLATEDEQIKERLKQLIKCRECHMFALEPLKCNQCPVYCCSFCAKPAKHVNFDEGSLMGDSDD